MQYIHAIDEAIILVFIALMSFCSDKTRIRVLLILFPIVITLYPLYSLIFPTPDVISLGVEEMSFWENFRTSTIAWFMLWPLWLLFIWTNTKGTFATTKNYRIAVTALGSVLIAVSLTNILLGLLD